MTLDTNVTCTDSLLLKKTTYNHNSITWTEQ
jgi:hypothetical protein